MSTYTSGPWHIGGMGVATAEPKNGEDLRVWATDGAAICDVSTRRTLGVRDNPIERANARLIAAAPELLACLDDIVRSLYTTVTLHSLTPQARQRLERAKAAIAKATQ